MTTEQLASLLAMYHDVLSADLPAREFEAWQYDDVRRRITATDLVRHLKWMCRQCLDVFLPSGDPDAVIKAHAWRGYIQGEMRALGLFSVNEMRTHTRRAAGKGG